MVEVKAILHGPLWNILGNNGNALGFPTAVADDDVICVFKKGSQLYREKVGNVKG